MKDQLVFDTTNATTILHSDSVGAFLRASDGTLLTHTDVGGKKALDVRVAEGINVEVDLSHVDDSVRLGDGTTLTTVTTVGGDNGLDVNIINTSLTVDDGGGSITVDGTVAATQSGTWTVGLSEDHNYGAVGAATLRTAAQIGNATGAADFGSGATSAQTLRVALATDSDLTVSDAALANTAVQANAETLDVASTAQGTVASILANRKYLFVYNNDNQRMEIGEAGFTFGAGFPISPKSYIELRAGAAVNVAFNSTKINHEIRTLELS